MFAPFSLKFYLNFTVSIEIQGLFSTDCNFQGLSRPWIFILKFKDFQELSRCVLTMGRVRGGVLPDMSHIGMCHPKGYGFCLVLVWKRVEILTILIWNRRFTKELRFCIDVSVVSISNEKERKWNMQIRNKTCNVAFFDHLQVWKRVCILKARSRLFRRWKALSTG